MQLFVARVHIEGYRITNFSEVDRRPVHDRTYRQKLIVIIEKAIFFGKNKGRSQCPSQMQPPVV